VTFPWIHDSEMRAARAEARLDADGAFHEAAQEYRDFKQRPAADPAWRRFLARRQRRANTQSAQLEKD
jgi:hypothetical protein